MTLAKHVDFEIPQWGELDQGPIAHSAYHMQVLALAPVGYWRLGETAGLTAADETGSHPGAYRGGHELNHTGALFRDADTAAWFDGNDGDMIVTTAVTTAADWTMLLWFAVHDADVTAQHVFMLLGLSPSRFGIGAWDRGSTKSLVAFDGHDGGLTLRNIHNVPEVFDDQWHQLAFTAQGDSKSLYLDGQLVSHATWTSAATTGQVHLASLQGSNRFARGRLDEAVLFDHVLTADQIVTLHRLGRGDFALTS